MIKAAILIRKEIANVLKNIGTSERLQKAKILEDDISQIRMLHFRSLQLGSNDVLAIAAVFEQNKAYAEEFINSVSFSYNPRIGDAGVAAIASSLPVSLSELGLVDCGLTDSGGIELLRWMERATELKMICMEQNNFSEKLQTEFRVFQKNNPHIMVVI